MAKGIKKICAVKKRRITDLTVSSISTADRGAGDGCRVMLIKRDPLLTAIDRAFADHWLGVDNAFAESVLDGTGGAGFDRRSAKLRKKLDRKLRAIRQGADLRPGDRADDRPSLSAGADPSDVESDDAFADRDGARRFRQNASPGRRLPRATMPHCRPPRRTGRRTGSARRRGSATSACRRRRTPSGATARPTRWR
jgi:hypothetical protein